MGSQTNKTWFGRRAGAVLSALVAVSIGSGCDLAMVDDADGPTDDPGELGELPLISMNSLPWESLADNLPALQALLTQRLGQSVHAAALADTSEGRQVLDYAVTCALPAKAAVKVADRAGAGFVFEGSLGLDPDWRSASPTRHDLECVGGCIAAHLNGLGKRISISVRGDDCGYVVDSSEGAYDFEEGAFASDDELHLYTCTGRGLEKACRNAAVPTLTSRLCTQGDPRCGQIIEMGSCASVCTGWSERGGYSGCSYNGRTLDMTTTWLEGGLPYPCDS